MIIDKKDMAKQLRWKDKDVELKKWKDKEAKKKRYKTPEERAEFAELIKYYSKKVKH